MKHFIAGLIAHPVVFYFTAALALAAFCAVVMYPRRSGGGREWILLALAACVLLIWRAPSMVWPQPFNIDEGQLAACALKATQDLAPWRGFDLTTSGPLDAAVLALPALIGERIDFFSSRLIGACLLLGTIYALYYAVKWIHGKSLAPLALIPPLSFLAFTHDWDFMSASTEQLPIFLTTTGLAAGAYLWRAARTRSSRLLACVVAGLCFGSAGFAKLQALPIALAGIVFASGALCIGDTTSQRNRKCEGAALLGASLFIPIVVAVSLWATGEWEDMVFSYVKGSFVHVASGTTLGLRLFARGSLSYAAFATSSLVVIGWAAFAIFRKARVSHRLKVSLGVAVAFLFVASLVIVIPRHDYRHYLLFAVVPLTYLTIVTLDAARRIGTWRRRQRLICGGILCCFFIPAATLWATHAPELTRRGWGGNPRGGILLPDRRVTAEVKAIARYAPPGSRIAVWGWMPHYYVLTQTIMATRDAQTNPQLFPGPYRDYFRNRFMSDLRANPPSVFLDAVAPGAFGYNDPAYRHESFLELADFVKANYELQEDVRGLRVYLARAHQSGDGMAQQARR